MPVAVKRLSRKYLPFERLLHSKRDELRLHLRDHRAEVLTERVPEDEGGIASRNLMEDLTVDTLEREQELLREIEQALRRLEEGDYAICENCGEPIPERRLRAVPWARFCVRCAELRQTNVN